MDPKKLTRGNSAQQDQVNDTTDVRSTESKPFLLLGPFVLKWRSRRRSHGFGPEKNFWLLNSSGSEADRVGWVLRCFLVGPGEPVRTGGQALISCQKVRAEKCLEFYLQL